jgi:hypothetical protein
MTTKKGNPFHVKAGKTNGGQFASPTGNSGGLDAAIKRYAKANKSGLRGPEELEKAKQAMKSPKALAIKNAGIKYEFEARHPGQKSQLERMIDSCMGGSMIKGFPTNRKKK